MKLKYAIAALAFIASVITGALLPLSASAASVYDGYLQTVPNNNLTVNGTSGLSTFDFGNMLASETSSSCSSDNRDKALESITSGKDYAMHQRLNSDVVDVVFAIGDTEFPPAIWTINGFGNYDEYVSLIFSSSSPYEIVVISWYNTSGINKYVCDRYTESWGGFEFLLSSSPTGPFPEPVALVEYRGFALNYPIDYEGEVLDAVGDDGTVPHFNYSVNNEKLLRSFYLRNIPEIVSGHRFEYKLYASNDEYAEVELLNQQELDIFAMYEYTLPLNDYYLLKIKHITPVPYLPMPHIKEVIFKIDYSNGGFIVGGTQFNDCANGVCEASVITCATGSFWEKINCQINKNLSFGMISPAFIAMKQILTSLTVPDSPACQLPLSNQTVLGRTIPLSSLDDTACGFANTVKESFPIIPIAINALYSLLLFRMIAGIVNRIINPKNAKIVEGI